VKEKEKKKGRQKERDWAKKDTAGVCDRHLLI
jgi:hypothetical protein